MIGDQDRCEWLIISTCASSTG